MSHELTELVGQAVFDLTHSLKSDDYEVMNETELCHMFWAALINKLDSVNFPTKLLKAEIHVRGGKVDVGIRSSDDTAENLVSGARSSDAEIRALLRNDPYDVMVEAKVSLRPRKGSKASKNSNSTSKKEDCKSDAKRLSSMVERRTLKHGALLILERGSEYLKNYLEKELEELGLEPAAIWLPTERKLHGPRFENIGLIWIHSANSDANVSSSLNR